MRHTPFPAQRLRSALSGALLALLLWTTSALPALAADATIGIGNVTLQVRIAKNQAERMHGLSDTPGLCENCGMLFVYPDRAVRFYVMRSMNYPLDFVWIAGDTVIGVTTDAPPEGEQTKALYRSPGPADKVLEVNAGFCVAHGLKPGDRLRLSGDLSGSRPDAPAD